MLPVVQKPITGVEQLFMRGVCQVRHNIVHVCKALHDEQSQIAVARNPANG
jgi:hypothetical protein